MSDPQTPLYLFPPNTVSNIALGSKGDVLQQLNPNITGFVSPGAVGTVLKSNGAGVAPSFGTAPNAIETYTIYSSGSGTYTPPAGCTSLIVEMVGGGGGGGRSTTATPSWGGNGGGYLKVRYPAVSSSYTVGTGGLGSTTAGVSGSNGVNTTFGTLVAFRGEGGNFDPNGSNSLPSANTTTGATSIFINISGGLGANAPSAVGAASPGGASFWAAPTPLTIKTTGFGVDSFTGYGGGGAGVSNSVAAGGYGGSGRIIITEIY
jgi:hypothetical protein